MSDSAKTRYGTISEKVVDGLGKVTRKNSFNSGEDPNPDPDLIIFFIDSSPLSDRAKTIYSTISQKVKDGFGRNLVDELVR